MDSEIKELNRLLKTAIKHLPSRFRCHEISRVLQKSMKNEGIKTRVEDGYAYYFPKKFLDAFKNENCKISFNSNVDKKKIEIEAENMYKKGKNCTLEKSMLYRISIQHSWLIVKEKYLIDCHRAINLNNSILDKHPVLGNSVVRKMHITNLTIISKIDPKTVYNRICYINDTLYWGKAIQKNNSIVFPDNGPKIKLFI